MMCVKEKTSPDDVGNNIFSLNIIASWSSQMREMLAKEKEKLNKKYEINVVTTCCMILLGFVTHIIKSDFISFGRGAQSKTQGSIFNF